MALHTSKNARDALTKRDLILSFPRALQTPWLFSVPRIVTQFFFVLAVTEYITLNRKRQEKYNFVNNLFAKMLNQHCYLLSSSTLASSSACILLEDDKFWGINFILFDELIQCEDLSLSLPHGLHCKLYTAKAKYLNNIPARSVYALHF